MKDVITLALLVILLAGCKNSMPADVQYRQADTIRGRDIAMSSDSGAEYQQCVKKAQGYTRISDVYISNFYEISNSISFDWDGDSKTDTVLLLAPLSRTQRCFVLANDELGEELVLALISTKDRGKEIKIFKNVFFEENPFLDYQDISASDKTLRLETTFGQGTPFHSYIYASPFHGHLYIDSIHLEMGAGIRDIPAPKTIRYGKGEFDFDNYTYQLTDSLYKAFN